jgi:hypothetical protein
MAGVGSIPVGVGMMLRACLSQLNFTSEAVFLENNFMSNFIGEAELFWKKNVW